MRKVRPVFIYTKSETTMDCLKPGDIFSLGKASPEDKVDESELYVVELGGDPIAQEGRPAGFYQVIGSRLIKDPDFGGRQ